MARLVMHTVSCDVSMEMELFSPSGCMCVGVLGVAECIAQSSFGVQMWKVMAEISMKWDRYESGKVTF